MSTDLAAHVQDVIDRRYGGLAVNLARRMGFTVSALLRGLKTNNLGIVGCLKLAHEIGDSPTTILRKGGKVEAANLLDQLYPGYETRAGLTGPEKRLLDVWQQQSPDAQKAFELLLKHTANQPVAKPKRRGRSRTAKDQPDKNDVGKVA
jgi:hypothetical protein